MYRVQRLRVTFGESLRLTVLKEMYTPRLPGTFLLGPGPNYKILGGIG